MREYCHGRNISRAVVLKPSTVTRGKYVCYLVKSRNRRFAGYSADTVAYKLDFNRPDLLSMFKGGRDATLKHVFYCLVDPAGLEKQLYFTFGYCPQSIMAEVTIDAIDAQMTVSESHPALLSRMQASVPQGCEAMVSETMEEVIRQGPLPDIAGLTLESSSDEDEYEELEELVGW